MAVYIVSRKRHDNLRKIVPRWIGQDIPVILFVDKNEHNEHDRLVKAERWRGIRVVSPWLSDQGIGYVRRTAVIHAKRAGLKSMIMCDDDMRPSVGSDMKKLLAAAENENHLGVGAVRSLHSWYSKGATGRHNGLMLCPGGWGMQLYALNVENAVEIGNFDERLDCFGEDHELMRCGIEAGFPWLVHTGVKCESIGSRYRPGGIDDLTGADRPRREIECRRIIHDMWPDYTSDPESRPRMSWAKMMDYYMPGWRAKSAIHGGAWPTEG